MSTIFHSNYYAHELTRRFSSEKFEKLSQSLFNATVDLNPHQIEAALFAFRSPLSRGAILADEVGLGKTIEAGLIISQLWAERKRRILIILPAALREQWGRELLEKFLSPRSSWNRKIFISSSSKAVIHSTRQTPSYCVPITSPEQKPRTSSKSPGIWSSWMKRIDSATSIAKTIRLRAHF